MQDVGEAQSDIFKTWFFHNSAGQMHCPEKGGVGLDFRLLELKAQAKGCTTEVAHRNV